MEQKSAMNQTYYRSNDLKKEMVLQKLRERGCRITKQRQLILGVILEEECISCKEIFYKAHTIDSTIGAATVYRMVSLLEDLGVFSRKNMYKISCGMDCNKENACMIEFEDSTVCQLSAKKWYQVISEGLKACGYGEGKKVASVEVEPCTERCC
ncbi:MAG: transcriptional repressor [Agathobacter sp.]|nr:transcriptional repressor [Agathobacter sp.]MBQ2283952.1 transcriptional repressor [Agathobacter sp.]